jgi:hypothetical protein
MISDFDLTFKEHLLSHILEVILHDFNLDIPFLLDKLFMDPGINKPI